MADKSRTPRSIILFNPYVSNVVAYLKEGTPTTNAERLGVLPTEVDQWAIIADKWEPLYIKYTDKKQSRTTSIKNELLHLIDQFIKLDQQAHILDRIASSPNVTIADLSTFNIKKGVLKKATRTVGVTPIDEPVVATIIPFGGGSFSIKCRSTTATRAGIFGGADSVQFAYKIGDTPPASAKEFGLIVGLSTKAIFTLPLGADASTKFLYIYFRWNNTKHPELAGAWGSLQTMLIL
jgi:hypothetical protein